MCVCVYVQYTGGATASGYFIEIILDYNYIGYDKIKLYLLLKYNT